MENEKVFMILALSEFVAVPIYAQRSGMSAKQSEVMKQLLATYEAKVTSWKHFVPMDMKMTCQQSRCHTLRFAEPLVGIIPHGAERPLMVQLCSYYANQLAGTSGELSGKCSRAGIAGNHYGRTLACAEQLACPTRHCRMHGMPRQA